VIIDYQSDRVIRSIHRSLLLGLDDFWSTRQIYKSLSDKVGQLVTSCWLLLVRSKRPTRDAVSGKFIWRLLTFRVEECLVALHLVAFSYSF